MRKKLIDEVMTFCKDRNIKDVDSSRIFVDVTVAFWTKLSVEKADSLRTDAIHVQSVITDVKIEGKPIQ